MGGKWNEKLKTMFMQNFGDKQRALWYVMVFLEWSIKFGGPKKDRCSYTSYF